MNLQQLKQTCKKSFKFYAQKFLRIGTKEMGIIPFSFNRMQKYLFQLLDEDLKAGRPVRWDILKGRQLGNSTFIVMFFFWCCTLFKNRNALVVAHDIPSAIEIHEKCQLAYSSLPDGIKPMTKTTNRRELFFRNPNPKDPDIGLNSKITVDTCHNKDLGASRTLHLALLSEIARYEAVRDPKDLMTSLKQSIPYVPGTAIFRETTAQGMGYWYDEWNDTNSIYRKIFISWIAEDKYRLEIYENEYFELCTEEKSLYGNEVLESGFIKEEIKKWYPEWSDPTPENFKRIDHEVMCRLAWRRWKIDNDLEKDKNRFRQEFPTTPDQAFLGSGGAVFDAESLQQFAAQVQMLKTEPMRFTFDVTAYDKSKDWWRRSIRQDPFGKLFVFNPPDPDKTYILGADVGYGIEDRDFSAAHILTFPDFEQCAVYHGVIPADYYGYLLYALGYYYNCALTVIEQSPIGMATINTIYHDLGYPNLYYRETTPEKRFNSFLDSIGFNVGPTTKPDLVAYGARIIREGKCNLKHMPTIEELKAFIKTEQNKFEAPSGKHDDLVMALLMAFEGGHQTYIPIRKPLPVPTGKFQASKALKRIDQKQGSRRYGENNLF